MPEIIGTPWFISDPTIHVPSSMAKALAFTTTDPKGFSSTRLVVRIRYQINTCTFHGLNEVSECSE
jgi:hypothetical protein